VIGLAGIVNGIESVRYDFTFGEPSALRTFLPFFTSGVEDTKGFYHSPKNTKKVWDFQTFLQLYFI
jgi:hypothetical protein